MNPLEGEASLLGQGRLGGWQPHRVFMSDPQQAHSKQHRSPFLPHRAERAAGDRLE